VDEYNYVVTTPRLKVRLHPAWREIQTSSGPATYVRGGESKSGALQFSLAQFLPGRLPSTSEQLLIGMCEKFASGVRGLKEKSSRSGTCEFGMFGTVVAKGDYPNHVQAWVLSNEREFILVTHTCDKDPDPQEVNEANEIALMTTCS
jgi:hypothetical protein